MAKTQRIDTVPSRSHSAPAVKARARNGAAKTPPTARATPDAIRGEPGRGEPVRSAWATDLVFDVREPKLAVSLRLDADVLRFFRGFGAGYQTRINEVLKAFMQARSASDMAPRAVVSARPRGGSVAEGKRAR